ncbi:MAG TPA: hypothetical protein PKA98_21955 [Acidimicrobiales bacterium]|nr:hypothetical protein [Acidimicrobiales bacterium]
MLAARSHERRTPHRSRLIYGPEWVSPYTVRRAALRRVTRSEPTEFRSSRGVTLLGGPDDRAGDGSLADVVDLTARRAERAAGAAAAVAAHPSNWQPA